MSGDYNIRQQPELTPVTGQAVSETQQKQKSQPSADVVRTLLQAKSALEKTGEDFSSLSQRSPLTSQKHVIGRWKEHFDSEKTGIKRDLDKQLTTYREVRNKLSPKINDLQQKISDKMQTIAANKRELLTLEKHANGKGPFSYTSRRITELRTDIARREGKLEKYETALSKHETELSQAKQDALSKVKSSSAKMTNIWNACNTQVQFIGSIRAQSDSIAEDIRVATKAGGSPPLIDKLKQYKASLDDFEKRWSQKGAGKLLEDPSSIKGPKADLEYVKAQVLKTNADITEEIRKNPQEPKASGFFDRLSAAISRVRIF